MNTPDIQFRRSNERGLANHGWLKSLHTFSFADYHDPAHMGFRSLRVINEDRIAGGTGFGKHPHRDMEIISYVVSGALKHEDTAGNKAVIRPGEVQMMSAGSGIAHSEMNERAGEEAHFFQIWIIPAERGGSPGYGQKSFEKEIAAGGLVLTASRNGRNGSIAIKQDADMYVARITKGNSLNFEIREKRGVWIQVVRGALNVTLGKVCGKLGVGDACASENAGSLKIQATANSEVILFDLA